MDKTETAQLTERLRRMEALDPLFVTLADALDIREVFKQVALVARAVVPHDLLALARFDEQMTTVRMHAISDEAGTITTDSPLTPKTRAVLERDFVMCRDLSVIVEPDGRGVLIWDPETGTDQNLGVEFPPDVREKLLGAGIRSNLYAAIRIQGRPIGALIFHSVKTGAYDLVDARMACRIADCVALALAHERLAQEASLAAAAQERAAQLEIRVAGLIAELASHGGPYRQIGVSKKWREVLADATKVAGTTATVLLMGESGTGKEVVARFIHGASPRSEAPFVALNCAALPEHLLESELFGHEKGAFTGALNARPGRIEQAAGGVLFLDEVGEMSPAVQAKFLRVLQEREFQRLGGTAVKRADVRVIAATNRDLKSAIASGQFREDLYYRLQVFEIRLPPLRERPEDIVALLDHFVTEVGASVGRPAAGLSVEAQQKLLGYHWPGNVRELRNAVERAVILCQGGLITSEHLPIDLGGAPPREPEARGDDVSTLPHDGVNLESLERGLVEQALARAGGNKSQAARLLGLTRAQLYNRLERYSIPPGERT